MRVWRRARGLIELMNGLNCGSLEVRPTGRREPKDDERRLAWKLVQRYALEDAARYERDCRGLAPTGVHALAELLKLSVDDYAVRATGVRQVAFRAAAIRESVEFVPV